MKLDLNTPPMSGRSGARPRSPRIVDDLEAVERPLHRVVVIGIAVAQLVHERGTQDFCVRERQRLVLAELPALAECRQIAFPHWIGRLVHA